MFVLYPIGSMYGIFCYIYHKNQLNVGEYTMHGSYGYVSPELTPSQMLHCKTSWWFQRICVFIPHCRNCSNLTTVMFFPRVTTLRFYASLCRHRYASSHPNAKLINAAVLPSQNASNASVVQAFYVHPDAWCG